MLKVPHEKSFTAYDCGTAVAQAVFKYHEVEWAGWSSLGLPCKIDGTDPRHLEILFRSAGFNVNAGEMSVDHLRFYTGLGWPVCCLVNRGGVGHWVIVKGFDSKCRIALMDPAEVRGTAVARAGFEAVWADVCRDGSKFERWGVAVG